MTETQALSGEKSALSSSDALSAARGWPSERAGSTTSAARPCSCRREICTGRAGDARGAAGRHPRLRPGLPGLLRRAARHPEGGRGPAGEAQGRRVAGRGQQGRRRAGAGTGAAARERDRDPEREELRPLHPGRAGDTGRAHGADQARRADPPLPPARALTVGRPRSSSHDPALVSNRWRAARAPLPRAPAPPRRLVLFLDVSGSMASYSRALLVFAYAVLRADARWEASPSVRASPASRACSSRATRTRR